MAVPVQMEEIWPGFYGKDWAQFCVDDLKLLRAAEYLDEKPTEAGGVRACVRVTPNIPDSVLHLAEHLLTGHRLYYDDTFDKHPDFQLHFSTVNWPVCDDQICVNGHITFEPAEQGSTMNVQIYVRIDIPVIGGAIEAAVRA